MHELRLFFTALQFFTRVPVPRWVGFRPDWLNHCTRYYPLVGLLVGITGAAVYALSVQAWSPVIAAVLCIAATIYMTGAFHEDGWADACDGLGGAVSRERAFEIMKDSRIGTYGTVGLVLLLGLKLAALVTMSDPQAVMAALITGHTVSRLCSAALIWRMDYAKEEGKAKPLGHRMSAGEFGIAASTTAVVWLLAGLSGWLSWASLFAALVAAATASVWMARVFSRRLGGYTGDCLGATQQLAEACFYLGVLLFNAVAV